MANKFLDNEIDTTTYTELKQRIESEKKACLGKLEIMRTPKCSNFEQQWDYAMSLISRLEYYIREGRLDTKRELIGVMFPEKFDFDGKTYRTNSYNKVLDVIYQQTNELQGNKKVEFSDFSENSTSVPRAVALARV